ncbi:MAG: NAD(P)H-hydrate dehydratase [Legionellaceae bacterium]|nr:NAD(P)H-hydrate dehydratase [Legionellaceae bacterium]
MTLQALAFSSMKGWLKPRANNANKGSFGHVLIIGGDYGMPGAVRLAAEAALRVGAGLVTVITRPEHVAAVVSGRPELLCYGLSSPQDEALKTCLSRATMIVLGPGLGQSSWSENLFDAVCLQAKIPLLIDADGLNWLAKKQAAWKPRTDVIFTPHPGEAARLLKISIAEVQAHRVQAILALQARFGGTFVLKGSGSLVCTNKKAPRICYAGNPGMASAGMGDVLSGVIAALRAQGLTPWNATQMGVLLHAKAGDIILKKQGGPGLLASDLIPAIHSLLAQC